MPDQLEHDAIALRRGQKQRHVTVTFEGNWLSMQYEISELISSYKYSLLLLGFYPHFKSF